MPFSASVNDGSPSSILRPEMLKWDDFMAKRNSGAPEGLTSGFHTSYTWAWMRSESAFVSGMLQGMGLAIACSFVTLVIIQTIYCS